MTSIVPTPFLFRYSLPVHKVKTLPKRAKTSLLGLPESCSLPNLREVDGANQFADVRVAWNDKGFGISALVSGRTMPLACDSKRPAESDGLQVWIDTRNTQNIHRASRFCHHFCFLPARKNGKPEKPIASQIEIARSRDKTNPVDAKSLSVNVVAKRGGYLLEAWMPANVLNGYDPEASPRLGFYYLVRDSELGEQYLTVDDKFPFASDPSVWSTLELSS